MIHQEGKLPGGVFNRIVGGHFGHNYQIFLRAGSAGSKGAEKK
jgi:hypothetical protein